MTEPIIKNYSNLAVSSNEMLINSVLNRSFKRLFQNDMDLLGSATDVYNSMYRVLPYDSSKTYQKNDLVWFVDFYVLPTKEEYYNEQLAILSANDAPQEEYEKLKESCFTVSLYLLRSLESNNKNFPKREYVDMVPVFDGSGWKNENPAGTIYTDYFEEFTAYNLKQILADLHDASKRYHKFGELKNYTTDISAAVLKKDLSNLDPNRSCFLGPTENKEIELPETKTIVEGSVRVWDCGLAEYDMIIKLGDSNSLFSSFNLDGSEILAEEIDANYFELSSDEIGMTELTKYDNRRYYLNDTDADIFHLSGGFTIIQGELVQHNVNGMVNTYCGTIEFPYPFIDTNYAIFPTNIPSSVLSGKTQLETNMNQLVFVNKSRTSVVAMMIIPNYTSGTAKILGSNRFRVQIVGRIDKVERT